MAISLSLLWDTIIGDDQETLKKYLDFARNFDAILTKQIANYESAKIHVQMTSTKNMK